MKEVRCKTALRCTDRVIGESRKHHVRFFLDALQHTRAMMRVNCELSQCKCLSDVIASKFARSEEQVLPSLPSK